jgi:hypothetical protein
VCGVITTDANGEIKNLSLLNAIVILFKDGN